MTRAQLINDLEHLGDLFESLSEYSGPNSESKFDGAFVLKFKECIETEIFHNGWYESKYVKQSLHGLSQWLKPSLLESWSQAYPFNDFTKKVAIIMAGNIPLVGFHDFLCCLISGYKVEIKLSSEDKRLFLLIKEALEILNPEYANWIGISLGKISDFNAVIGTGSDSALLHFKSYFKETPHLLRGNRTSLAVLDGHETKDELLALGHDIFDYFGRGCRSITHLLLPNGYDIQRFFEAILPFHDTVNHKKYGNNYDYQKTIHLMNQSNILDNHFLLAKETDVLQAPLAMIHYHYYNCDEDIENYLNIHEEKIQCVAGRRYLPFGRAQNPELHDYADHINTLNWLSEL